MVHPILFILLFLLILSVPVFFVLLMVKGKPQKRMPILGWLLIFLGILLIFPTVTTLVHFVSTSRNVGSYLIPTIPTLAIYLMMIYIGWKIR